MTNLTNLTNQKKSGGYQNLIVYQLAVPIFDLTMVFCQKYIDYKSRTKDQMEQAARSGKQNIVEGSLEKSLENYLLDQMIRSLEQKFITQGGYSENLFKRRLQSRRELD